MKIMLLVICFISVMSFIGITVLAQTNNEVSLAYGPASVSNYYMNYFQSDVDGGMMESSFFRNINNDDDINQSSFASKMAVGVINVATSWTDIPREVAKVLEEQNLLVGFTYGFGKGLAAGLARGTSGAIDVATFGLPPYDKPLLRPEYRVKEPNGGFKISILEW